MPKSDHADQSAQSQSCAYHAAIVTAESCRVDRCWINSDLPSSLIFIMQKNAFYLVIFYYCAAIVTAEPCRVARCWINSDLPSSLLFTYRTVSYFLRNLTIGCDQGQRSGVFSLKTLLWFKSLLSDPPSSLVCNCKISPNSPQKQSNQTTTYAATINLGVW